MTHEKEKAIKAKAVKVPEAPPAEEENLFDVEDYTLADVAGTGGAAFEGELKTLEQIQGQKVRLHDYKLLPSSFREGGTYICLQLEDAKGVKFVVNSSATVILKIANVDKAKLPLPTAFYMSPGKPGGKPYWNYK
jgi:hypothetical protein